MQRSAVALMLTTFFLLMPWGEASTQLVDERGCTPPMMSTQSAAATPLDGCDGGGGGGGGGGTPPPAVFVTSLNGQNVDEFVNPLHRFTVMPVANADGDGDQIVHLAPLPYHPDLGITQSTITSVTDGEIATSVALFGLTNQAIAEQIHRMMSVDPSLDDVRDQAILRILTGQYHAAVDILQDQPTPVDIFLWCGPEGNPLRLRWVAAIPVSMTCGTGTLPASVALVAVTTDVVQFAGELTPPPVGGAKIDAIEFDLLATSQASSVSKYVVGMSFRGRSFGATTRIDKSWTVSASLENLATGRGDTASLDWTIGFPTDPPQLPESRSFELADRLMFTFGDRLSRGRTMAANVTGTPHDIHADVEEFPAATAEYEWAMLFTHDHPDNVKFIDALYDDPLGYSFAMRAAKFPAGLKLGLRQPGAGAAGWHAGVIVYRGLVQPEDPTADAIEARLSAYHLGSPVSTMQMVGVPGFLTAEFDHAGIDDVHRIDIAKDPDGINENGGRYYLRTLLVTSHLSSIDASATGNYADRLVMQGSALGDPLTPEVDTTPFVAVGVKTDWKPWMGGFRTRYAESDPAEYSGLWFKWGPKPQQLPKMGYKVGHPDPPRESDLMGLGSLERVDDPNELRHHYVWALGAEQAAPGACMPELSIDGRCR